MGVVIQIVEESKNPKNMNSVANQYDFLSYFDMLSDQELDIIKTTSNKQLVPKDKMIYKKGDKASHVYFLIDGSVKLYSEIMQDQLLIKDLILNQVLFGENIFAGTARRSENAQAAEDSEVLVIPAEIIIKLTKSNERFARLMLDLMVDRLNELEDRMKNFMFKSAKDRIKYFIRKMGDKKGIDIGIDEKLIHLGMSHKDIAFFTDTSRQTVARVLSDLKRNNIIHFSARKPSKILIRNIAHF